MAEDEEALIVNLTVSPTNLSLSPPSSKIGWPDSRQRYMGLHERFFWFKH